MSERSQLEQLCKQLLHNQSGRMLLDELQETYCAYLVAETDTETVKRAAIRDMLDDVRRLTDRR